MRRFLAAGFFFLVGFGSSFFVGAIGLTILNLYLTGHSIFDLNKIRSIGQFSMSGAEVLLACITLLSGILFAGGYLLISNQVRKTQEEVDG
ncbi:MAG: hypothetical protein N2D54_01840 [Chloroflexota bacterium]